MPQIGSQRNRSLTSAEPSFNRCQTKSPKPLRSGSAEQRNTRGLFYMGSTKDELLADDLVLGIWAAIALLGAARECSDTADLPGLVSKAERILSGVIPHLARLALAGAPASAMVH
jgi:hypothetical protein